MVITGQKNKHAYPFANFFKAGHPRKGFQHTDNIRPTSGRKQRYADSVGGKSSCQESPKVNKKHQGRDKKQTHEMQVTDKRVTRRWISAKGQRYMELKKQRRGEEEEEL